MDVLLDFLGKLLIRCKLAGAVLRLNRICENKLSGVFLRGDYDHSLIEDNYIEKNGAHGVEIDGSYDIEGTLRRNHIRENKGNGIRIVKNVHGSIEENEIIDNGGGGIAISEIATSDTSYRSRLFLNGNRLDRNRGRILLTDGSSVILDGEAVRGKYRQMTEW